MIRQSTVNDMEKFDKDRILHINFNQDQGILGMKFYVMFICLGCFAVATESGFRVYNTFPLKETFSRDLGSSIGYVEMFYRSNILAFVSGGSLPKKPLDVLWIWDDNKAKELASIDFKGHEVKSIKLRANKVVAVLENRVFIYNFSDLKLIDAKDTCPNPKGLCSLNNEPENTILVCPDAQIGHIIVELYDQKKSTKIKAHQSTLSFLELSPSGNKLASSSEKGTVIRIHNPYTGEHVQELRRGLEYAQIYSLSFDYSGKWLAISCDSGTIHIFNLKLTEEEKIKLGEEKTVSASRNPKSKLWFMKYIIPYFDSEWSFAKFRVQDTRTKVGFGPEPNTIVVLSYEGNYYTGTFDPIAGGDCKRDLFLKIFDPEKYF